MKILHYRSAPRSVLLAVAACYCSIASFAAATPAHVVVVIMENHAYSEIIGNSDAPYINTLAANGAVLTKSFAIEHPSQPNYLDLFSGANQGVTNDATPLTVPFSTPNLGAELLANNLTFAIYSESLPSIGFTGDSATTVPGKNQYVRKHNPAVNWQASDAPNSNHLPPSVNQPFTAFPTTDAGFAALPTISIVVPNEQNDMHDGTVAMGDQWLSQNLEAYRKWATDHNSLLLLTFDEDDHSASNQITTIFAGQNVRPSMYDETSIERAAGQGVDHFNALRTLEDFYALGTCNPATDGSRKAIVDLFRGPLLNISTRLSVQTGENVLIGGFIISGSDPKKVIVRGIGPSLAKEGVNQPLVDPVLELHDKKGVVASNDNWQDKQKAEIQASGVAPTRDKESAIVKTLPGNGANYTAILSGKGGTTGVGVVEAYDLDQAANSNLANISTRGFVNTGENVMIGGVIIGQGTGKVLVRALGPSLTQSGVQNALPNPTLALHNADGDTIAQNNDWKSDQEQEIRDTTIPPSNELESAIVKTLPAGKFTAIVSGVNSGVGVALVEIYNLP
jgi:hypothetical protein